MMNSDEYARIGKKLKNENPDKWRGNTDEEVGVVAVKRGLATFDFLNEDEHLDFDIDQTLRSVSLDAFPPLVKTALSNLNSRTAKPSIFLAPFRRMAIDSRSYTYRSETEEIASMVAQMQASELAFKQAVHNAQLPSTIRREHQLITATHQTAILTLAQTASLAKLSIEIATKATQEGLTVEAYISKLAMLERVEEKQRMDELSRIHEKEQAQTRIELATTASMADLLQERQLREGLEQARRKQYQIETGTDPLILKQKLLKDVENEIISLENRINGLTERHRQADNEKATGTDA